MVLSFWVGMIFLIMFWIFVNLVVVFLICIFMGVLVCSVIWLLFIFGKKLWLINGINVKESIIMYRNVIINYLWCCKVCLRVCWYCVLKCLNLFLKCCWNWLKICFFGVILVWGLSMYFVSVGISVFDNKKENNIDNIIVFVIGINR